MSKFKFALFFLIFTTSIFSQSLDKFVNPMIGTGGHGHTYPGATLPFGMVQLSPDTRIDGSWDGCSGYHYSDSIIYGFSHTHLNGTGVSDFGDIMLMPTMGTPELRNSEYSSKFSHQNEKASAGFYSVKLDKFDIDVKLTTSTRVGFHQYTFNRNGQANIVLDLNHRDALIMGEVRIIDDYTIEVVRRSSAWASDQYVYAQIQFDHPMKVTKALTNAFAPAKTSDSFFAGSIVGVVFSTDIKIGETIKVKVSLSPTSVSGAKLNAAEISDWDFEKVHRKAQKTWSDALSSIKIVENNTNKKTIFYTALYHTMVQPNIAQDIDGSYRGRDGENHKTVEFDYYSVFSLWDTFRAAHPLYTLIDKKRTSDFINTFLKQYEQGGRLPVWELASNETDCMIGYHSVSVMADAMAKGITGFDYEKCFEAAKHSATLDHLGLEAYKKNGFISIDDEHESVSKTVEYAYDDWCIAQMAKILHKEEDYNYFMRRSQSWKNLFDWQTTFIRPKKNGGWDKPFDPREVNNNFTEGNAWQYTFFVPQDILGMIEAFGGKGKFEAKLDQMFNSESKTTGREQVDVTGLIGQYAHGNEPSHHMAYLYNFVGKPDKTSEKVSYILDNFYKNSPDGLIGNEDCGQMSAWYVLSSMGLYSVTPGSGDWTKTNPYFKKSKIKFENGEQLSISKKGMKGYLKEVNFTAKPNTFKKIITVPVIESNSKSFSDELKFTVLNPKPIDYSTYDNLKTYCKIITGKYKNPSFFLYDKGPTTITESATVLAYSEVWLHGKPFQSDTISTSFFKKPNNYTIKIKSQYNPQYHAGGPEGLIDGILGTENWRKGDWQGYQGQDFEAVLDLKQMIDIQTVNSTFLQDSRSWILMPTQVDYYISDDNINFVFFGSVKNDVDANVTQNTIKEFIFKSPIPQKAQYIKVVAKNFGKLPPWHQGSGEDAFIFIDEISVK